MLEQVGETLRAGRATAAGERAQAGSVARCAPGRAQFQHTCISSLPIEGAAVVRKGRGLRKRLVSAAKQKGGALVAPSAEAARRTGAKRPQRTGSRPFRPGTGAGAPGCARAFEFEALDFQTRYPLHKPLSSGPNFYRMGCNQSVRPGLASWLLCVCVPCDMKFVLGSWNIVPVGARGRRQRAATPALGTQPLGEGLTRRRGCGRCPRLAGGRPQRGLRRVAAPQRALRASRTTTTRQTSRPSPAQGRSDLCTRCVSRWLRGAVRAFI